MTVDVPGIHRVSTQILVRVLRALHRDILPSPVTRSSMIEKGFGDFERDIDVLVGLDKRAAQAVISAVLKERGSAGGALASLTFMGPPSPGTRSRDVRDVVREQIATATRTITIMGLSAADGALLSTLSAAVQGRALSADIALSPALDDAARAIIRERLAPLGVRLHALAHVSGEALLIDGVRLYVSSAPLHATEDDGLVAFGVLIEDVAAVRTFDDEWQKLSRNGHLVPL